MKLNFNYEEAADALGIGVPTLKRNIRRYPHRGYGDRVLFSLEDLHAINEIHFVAPGQKAIDLDEPTPLPKPAAQSVADLKPRGARKKTA